MFCSSGPREWYARCQLRCPWTHSEFSLSVFKTDPSYSTNHASTLVCNGIGKTKRARSFRISVTNIFPLDIAGTHLKLLDSFELLWGTCFLQQIPLQYSERRGNKIFHGLDLVMSPWGFQCKLIDPKLGQTEIWNSCFLTIFISVPLFWILTQAKETAKTQKVFLSSAIQPQSKLRM